MVVLAQLVLLDWQAAVLDLLVGRSELQEASVDGFVSEISRSRFGLHLTTSG